MHQESLPIGLVLRAANLVPLRAVGEHEGQLPWFCAFQSISPFALLAFTGFIAPTRRSDFSLGFGQSFSLPPALPRFRGPKEISWSKNNQCPAAPVPHTVLATVEYWASRFRARLPPPGRPHGASLAFGAAVRLRLLPHAPSRCRAVAFGSQLPPTGPVGDLHPQSIIHVQHTRSRFARPPYVQRQAKPWEKSKTFRCSSH